MKSLKIRSRRQARECALRALYQVEVGGQAPEATLEATIREMDLSDELADFARDLVEGVTIRGREIDALIRPKLQSYTLDRLAAVDRTILRLATYEFIARDETPPRVTLNEAIELAKRYSTAESGRFVNGVLGAVLLDTPKAHWTPPLEDDASPVEEIAEPEPEEPIPIEDADDLDASSIEAKELRRVGAWTLRSEDTSS
ncbi:MAG: transcription antitermination factor NusB [Fimbriimonadaceae bacterium]